MNARERLRQAIGRTVAALEAMGYELPPDIDAPDAFALRGTGTPGRKPAAIQAVNSYQNKLQLIYSDWADELSDDLADADPSEQDDIIKKALAALLLLLRNAGRTALPNAVTLGLGDVAHTPEILKLLAEAVNSNDKNLDDSLLPDLEQKIRSILDDDDIQDAIVSGKGAEAISGGLAGMLGRIATYAGAYWMLTNQATGTAAKENGKKIIGYLDADAQHCSECPLYQSEEGTVYDSYDDYLEATGGLTPGLFQCGPNCRCRIVEADEDSPGEAD